MKRTCDRCGKKFKNYPHTEYYPKYLVRVKDGTNLTLYMEFCRSCNEQLEKFIFMEENNEQ